MIVLSRLRQVRGALSGCAVLLTLSALIAVDLARAPSAQAAIAPPLTVAPVVGGLSIPWDMAFTPDGTMIYDQRGGVISARLTNGVVNTMTTSADFTDLAVVGESGLLGLVVDPQFSTNRWIYTCQSFRSGPATISDVRVVRWRVDAAYTDVVKVGPILTGIPAGSGRHNGCRLLFDGAGLLYVATGDAATGTNPQNRMSLAGKVLRITRDGTAAPGNPFLATPGTDPRIFTLGHRNPQGLALQPSTGRVWSIEHGTSRDDEVNLLQAGGNYGWNPVPGYDESTPMTNPNVPGALPAKYSTGSPTLALSGGTFVTGDRWGEMNGGLAVAALSTAGIGHRLLVFGVIGTNLTAPEAPPELVTTYGRLRSVTQGPDTNLYVSTSNGSNDSILSVAPPAQPSPCSGALDPTPSGVAMSSAGPTTVVRGTDRSAFYTVGSSGTFIPLGGRLTQGPAAVSWGGDRTDVFVVGDDRALYHKAGGSGGFGAAWGYLGGALTSSPLALSFATGTLEVFARGTDCALWWKRWTGTAWTNWTSLGGVLASAPGGAVDPDSGRAVVGARGTNGALQERIMTTSGPATPWTARPDVLASSPAYAAAANGIESFTVVYLLGDGAVQVRDAAGSRLLNGYFIGGPAALLSGVTLTVAGRGLDDALWRHNGSGWNRVGGVLR